MYVFGMGGAACEDAWIGSVRSGLSSTYEKRMRNDCTCGWVLCCLGFIVGKGREKKRGGHCKAPHLGIAILVVSLRRLDGQGTSFSRLARS